MAKKKVNKIEISGEELTKLLSEAWELGCMTGRNQADESAKEQSDDCIRVLKEKYKTLKVEVNNVN